MSESGRLYSVEVPDLGMPGVPITLSVWLVPLGAEVVQGDRVVEVEVADAIIDLPAPSDGILATQNVAEDEQIILGQVLGQIRIVD